jgi:hypothetical protein
VVLEQVAQRVGLAGTRGEFVESYVAMSAPPADEQLLSLAIEAMIASMSRTSSATNSASSVRAACDASDDRIRPNFVPLGLARDARRGGRKRGSAAPAAG